MRSNVREKERFRTEIRFRQNDQNDFFFHEKCWYILYFLFVTWMESACICYCISNKRIWGVPNTIKLQWRYGTNIEQKKKKEFSSFEIRKHCHIHTRPPYSDVRSIILDFACCSISCDSPLGGRNTESNMITDYQIPRRPVDFYAEAHHMQWTWQLNTRTGVHRAYINLWWKRWPPHRTV